MNADIALYRAKSRGRNRWEFFTDALQAEIVHAKHLGDEIMRGLETDAFMRVAEEIDAVATIDRAILERALRDHRAWTRAGWSIPKVSVNVSSSRLHDEALVASLRELAFEPGTLAFELVESVFLDDQDDILEANIESIKRLGIEVEIDDFGKGHASIVSLLELEPSRLKIDRQLIAPIVDNPAQRDLVRSIIEIGKSLGIGVVAEGVETLEHAAILRDLGCDRLQGYALARPMPFAEICEFMRVQQCRIDALAAIARLDAARDPGPLRRHG